MNEKKQQSLKFEELMDMLHATSANTRGTQNYTVVGVVVSVLGTLINTSSAGTGLNPTIGIQSSIVAVNFYRTLSIR
jgi:hypothetical protein